MTTVESGTAPPGRAARAQEGRDPRRAPAAATRLARRDGPDSLTVEEVCAEVGVSARTFFNYFASKDDAPFGGDAGTLTTISDDVVGRPAGEDPVRSRVIP